MTAAGSGATGVLQEGPAGRWYRRRCARRAQSMDLDRSSPVPMQASTSGSDDWELDPADIVFQEKIAAGAFGDLYKGVYCGQDVAIKILRNVQDDTQQYQEFLQARGAGPGGWRSVTGKASAACAPSVTACSRAAGRAALHCGPARRRWHWSGFSQALRCLCHDKRTRMQLACAAKAGARAQASVRARADRRGGAAVAGGGDHAEGAA